MPPSTMTEHPKGAEARRSGWRTIRKVTPYLWPAAHPWVKHRVVIALGMLLLARVISVYTPFFYAEAVDVLSGEATPSGMLMLGAVGLTVAYGVARAMSVGFQQLRDVVFARVGQRALRQLALETFEHIHALSLRYHITRKTGGLSRIIERGDAKEIYHNPKHPYTLGLLRSVPRLDQPRGERLVPIDGQPPDGSEGRFFRPVSHW